MNSIWLDVLLSTFLEMDGKFSCALPPKPGMFASRTDICIVNVIGLNNSYLKGAWVLPGWYVAAEVLLGRWVLCEMPARQECVERGRRGQYPSETQDLALSERRGESAWTDFLQSWCLGDSCFSVAAEREKGDSRAALRLAEKEVGRVKQVHAMQ